MILVLFGRRAAVIAGPAIGFTLISLALGLASIAPASGLGAISSAPGAMAGLAIGLTLAAIYLVGINVTGLSFNPARSVGPAVFVGGKALADLWVFIAAPMVGGILAGILHRAGVTQTD